MLEVVGLVQDGGMCADLLGGWSGRVWELVAAGWWGQEYAPWGDDWWWKVAPWRGSGVSQVGWEIEMYGMGVG